MQSSGLSQRLFQCPLWHVLLMHTGWSRNLGIAQSELVEHAAPALPAAGAGHFPRPHVFGPSTVLVVAGSVTLMTATPSLASKRVVWVVEERILWWP